MLRRLSPVVRCNYNECIFCQSWSSSVGHPRREPASSFSFDNEKIKYLFIFFVLFAGLLWPCFFFEWLTGNYEIIPIHRAVCLYVKLFKTFNYPPPHAKSGYGKKYKKFTVIVKLISTLFDCKTFLFAREGKRDRVREYLVRLPKSKPKKLRGF